MMIADVRVIQADIPVERPHKMSFTTLEAVNFVFVRLETVDGLVGWGEAACLGGFAHVDGHVAILRQCFHNHTGQIGIVLDDEHSHIWLTPGAGMRLRRRPLW